MVVSVVRVAALEIVWGDFRLSGGEMAGRVVTGGRRYFLLSRAEGRRRGDQYCGGVVLRREL